MTEVDNSLSSVTDISVNDRNETLTANSEVEEVDELPASTSVNPHSDPNWLENFRKNFQEEVIMKCSNQAIHAVENNVKIEV